MKSFFKISFMALAIGLLAIGCSKKEDDEVTPNPKNPSNPTNPSNPSNPPVASPLKFTPENPSVEVEKTTTVSIVGTWNTTDKVKIDNEEVAALQGAVQDNKLTLLGKKVGTTKVHILSADNKERGSFELTVSPKLLLSFTPEKAVVKEGETTTITFSGVWNATDRVKIDNEEVAALQGAVQDNKLTLLGKKAGTTKVHILSADNKERGSFELTVSPKLLLSFTPEKAVVKEGETTTITFSGVWNTTDRVQIVNGEIAQLQGNVTDNKITLLAKKAGTTKVEIFTQDNRSRGSFEVSVYILASTLKLPHKNPLPHYRTDITDREEYKRLIEERLVAYEKLMLKLENLEKYPLDIYRYNDQNNLYLEGIRISRAAKQYYKENKDTASIRDLKNTYENLHQYGVCYAEVEIMVRIAEQYRKKYPTHTEIENLIKENFNGEYGNIDGPNLTNYLNDNMVTTYNKIIDIVNTL
nr:GAG-binding domain-containing protein [uncultured Capnocytophaga sp.]